MAQQAMQVDTTISYVNPRQGRRPPNIKDVNGTFFTISDAGLQMAQQYNGQQCRITYYTNQSGYHVATHLNGIEVPRDPGRGGPPQGQPAGQPAGQGQPRGQYTAPSPDVQVARGHVKAARIRAYADVAAAVISVGGTAEDFSIWVAAIGMALGSKQQQPPPQQPPPSPPQEAQQPQPAPPQEQQGGDDFGDFDDDIPF